MMRPLSSEIQELWYACMYFHFLHDRSLCPLYVHVYCVFSVGERGQSEC